LIPYVPHHFVDGDNLDMEKINDNLEAIGRDIERSLEARYTYSTITLDIDGVTEASAAVLRAVAIRRPSAGNALEVYAVEVVLYAAGAVVWTLACSDTSWPSITVTAAGATVEAHASGGIPVSVTSAAADLTFTLTPASASTCTRGYIVVHLRVDRGNQGTSHAGHFPALLTSATTAPATSIDAELVSLAAAAARDTTNSVDVRCEMFSTRGLTSGSSVSWALPSGARRILGSVQYVVGAAGSIATGTVTGTGLSGSSAAATATGATVLVATVDAASGSLADEPMDSTDDATVTITVSGGVTAALAALLVFWS